MNKCGGAAIIPVNTGEKSGGSFRFLVYLGKTGSSDWGRSIASTVPSFDREGQMQKPPITTGSETLHKIGIYHACMLTAYDETQDLGESFTPVLNMLDLKYQARVKAGDLVTQAYAHRKFGDRLLDRLLKKIEALILSEVNRNRQSPLYRKLFPKGLSGLVNVSPEEEVRLVTVFRQMLRESKPELAEQYDGQIEQAQNRLSEANSGLKAAIDEEARTFAEEKNARIDFITRYKKNYGSLIDLFPDDRNLVEEFFMPFRSSGGSVDESDETPPASTPS